MTIKSGLMNKDTLEKVLHAKKIAYNNVILYNNDLCLRMDKVEDNKAELTNYEAFKLVEDLNAKENVIICY